MLGRGEHGGLANKYYDLPVAGGYMAANHYGKLEGAMSNCDK